MAIIAHVQSRAAASTADGSSLAYTTNVVAGNLLVVAIKASGTIATATVTDTQGNVYALAGQLGSASHSSLIYSAIAGSSGANSVTVTTSTAATRFTIHEYSSSTGWESTELDKNATGSGTGSPSSTSATAATTVPDELLFTTTGTVSDVTSPAALASWNYRVTGASRCLTADRIVSATATYTGGHSWTGTDNGWRSVIATFKPIVSDTPPTPGFSTAIDLKTVTVTDTSVAGTNPITTRQYVYDTVGDPTTRTTSLTHQYTVGGTYTITQYVNDGVTAEQSTTHNVTTETRYQYTVQTVGGRSASVTADRPDA
jgi:hypothetical protein